MSTFGRFEELIAWQKARVLNADIYRVTLEGRFERDFALRDQIRKSSISVMSNIAEGYGREGPKEFIYFLTVAKASCFELCSQLYAALDIGYIEPQKHKELLANAEEVARIIVGLKTSIQKKHALPKKYVP